MDPILAGWTYHATADAYAVVCPDGCRDVIRCEVPDRPVRWLITDIDDTARTVSIEKGTRLTGWRLRPGTTVCRHSVQKLVNVSTTNLERSVSDCCALSDHAAEVLGALRESRNVDEAAYRAGVSRRTLQRTTTKLTTRPPRFWMQLARVRRAARLLGTATPLSVVPLEVGFSDQAHMTREVQRWLRVTPGALRRDRTLLATLSSPGFD